MEKGSANDSAMLLVGNRLGTFSMWPFKEEEGSTCTPARSATTTVTAEGNVVWGGVVLLFQISETWRGECGEWIPLEEEVSQQRHERESDSQQPEPSQRHDRESDSQQRHPKPEHDTQQKSTNISKQC